MKDLGTIGGTQVLDQGGLNERGQTIGEMTLADEIKSHPFLWDGEKLIDLETFGGDHGNANALNDEGEVTGYAQYPISCPEPGAGPIAHAYLWRKGVKTDLGTVPGINPLDGGSTGWSINSKTQIVGISTTCDFSIVDAFLWEDGGPMIDLNTLIASGTRSRLLPATLYEAASAAMAEFRRCGFTTDAPGSATRLTVTVKAPATSYELQWGKVETWLQSAGKPNEQGLKGRLRNLLRC
jgi:probable HAF family extracellular repeat protein